MAGVPRTTVEDDFTSGLSCAICGQPELYVQHLPAYPDFVTCRSCGAAFVVEDTGERVMYGKLPDGYPDTTEFAFRQWVWLEAVKRRAVAERPAPEAPSPEAALRSAMAEAPQTPSEPEPIEESAPEELDWLSARLRADGMPAGVPIPTEPEPYRPMAPGVPLAADTGPTDDSLPSWLREAPPPATPRVAEPGRPSAPAVAATAVAAAAVTPMAAVPAVEAAGEGSEPSPSQRHRVVVQGDRIRMPVNACAHCQRSPAPNRLPVPGSLPKPGSEAARRTTTFQIPLCDDCQRRAGALSSEQRSGRVMAVLMGTLAGLVGVVTLLALGIISFAENPVASLIILGVTWMVAFVGASGFMLARASRAPRSPDAIFVRTTLRVAADSAAPQTAFEWRHGQTAQAFYEANAAVAVAKPSLLNEPAASA